MESLPDKLKELCALSSENEIVEFKLAENDYDFRSLCKYISALANEANVTSSSAAWFVLGIRDSDHRVLGTRYRLNPIKLQSVKSEISKQMTDGFTVMSVNEVILENGKRAVMFKIPPAPRGIPIGYQGHYYARNHEDLAALSMEKLDRIRAQGDRFDWSKQICMQATISDLDPAAIKKARDLYAIKNPKLKDEIAGWSDRVFLNKARITINGGITNTAILLLGRPETTHYLSPAVSKISWILKSRVGEEKDYEHFTSPLLISVDQLYQKVRNLKYRYLAEGTLFPDEVNQYEPFTIREALNNCIAHQDYTKAGKINVVEVEDDSLIFSNRGSFLPGSVERVIEADAPFEYYRNRYLAEAMVNLNMIDTIGSGIKRLFRIQKDKFFPLPDYTIDDEQVTVQIAGRVLDIGYARKLALIPDLDLPTMMLLDKVQKKKPITKDESKLLRNKGLIEGRYPRIYVSSKIAAKTNDTAEYMKRRGIDEKILKKMTIEYLQVNGTARRSELDGLLVGYLPSTYTERQRKTRIRNLLQELRVAGYISTTENRQWVLGVQEYTI